jgi:hypothetical protein
VKVRDGLHESGDGHMHVSGNHYTLYETKSGDFKLVPRRSVRKGPAGGAQVRRTPMPKRPSGGISKTLRRGSR